MITSSALSKKIDYQPISSMSNLMLRTDGFKKVVKGLTYNKTSAVNIIRNGSHTYTSMGKRTPMMHY
jgi:hypothetical protein